MVDHLHNPLPHVEMEPVVYAGHGVEQDHGTAVDGGAHHRPGIASQGGEHNRQHQREDAEGRSDHVGGHIENFLTAGIVWHGTVFEFDLWGGSHGVFLLSFGGSL